MPEMQTFNTHKLVKQILYSLFISLGTMAGIFAILSFRGISIDLSSFHPGWLLAGVVFIVMAWFIDALRLLITARAWGKKIPYRNALTAVLSCYFMSAVTPSATGGSPAEMLVMNRSGFSWGEAGSLTAICGILYQVTLLILLCILIFFFGISFTLQGILLNLLYSFLVFYGTLMFLLFFFLYREDLVYRMVNWGIRFARKRFPKLKFTDEDVIDWVKNFFADFKSGFRILCREKPWYLLWNVLGYALYFIFFFSVGFFALLALGVHI
ncbi:MAG: lysylphosphatidylglycerol synthase transmembrane domain-containing protein, partial [Atribacterota bacterium]